jgi:DNA mismatch endonuclease, patch repair protein
LVDNVSKEKRSQIMKAIKHKETKLESRITKELFKRGIRYRKNRRDLFGVPDISVKKWKLVIFIDSCFWHGCPIHIRLPKSNEDYWKEKITRNMKRDSEVTSYYKENGWNILRIWEHEIKDDIQEVIDKVYTFILNAKKIHAI